MLETRDLYKDYINAVELKINLVTVKIEQYNGSLEYIKTCIINNRAEFEAVDVSIETLFANPYIAYAKIKQLVDNGQLTRVAHYVKTYVNAINYLNLHKRLFDYYNKCLMPYEVYLKLIASGNLEIGKHILKGEYYTFGNAGRLYIKEKARTFFFNGRKAKLPVDWGLSNKYKTKLIADGKIPYDINTAPNGVKWHIYHVSEYGHWFWWESVFNANRGFFKFLPSKFYRRYNKKDIPFTSKEEVYNTTEIGILNKMLELMKLDPAHSLNYRRLEKPVNKEIHQFEFVNH